MAKDQRRAILARQCSMTVLGNSKQIVKTLKEGELYLLGTIIGKATAFTRKPNPKDPEKLSTKFIGMFEFTPADRNLPIVQSPNMYLPEFYADVLAGSIGEGEGIKAVHFMAEASLVAKESSATGYVYELEMKTNDNVDPLAELRSEFDVETPLLEAPKGKKGKGKKKK